MTRGTRDHLIAGDPVEPARLSSMAPPLRQISWSVPYIGDEELAEVAATVRSGRVTMGPRVQEFERQLARYLGRKHAIAVSNGTAALDVMLKALRVGPGDEVIIPAFTYVATANAVSYQGAKPVPVDIEPRSFNLDPGAVEASISARTRAVIAIDYAGSSSDHSAIATISAMHGIPFLLDGAHSLGGYKSGRPLCADGLISTVSFHAAKVMTTVEGGAVLTDDDDVAEVCRMVRNQGEDPRAKYLHPAIGNNYRMSDLHAAIGLAQFRRLDTMLAGRAATAGAYTAALSPVSDRVGIPAEPVDGKHAWFTYPITVDNRDAVAQKLARAGVETRAVWSTPIHRQPIYKDSGLSLPVSESVADHVLNLPLYYGMDTQDRDYVVGRLLDAVVSDA